MKPQSILTRGLGSCPAQDSRIQFNRRQFLKTAIQAGAILAAPQVARGVVLGKDGGVAPSEQIRLGAIGIGNRGSYDLGCFLQEPDVRFVAICDVKAERREAVKKRADEKNGNQDCAMYRDLRDLLARSDIDAVLIATGPNWHATAAIMSANAGKDVYCAKPGTGGDLPPNGPCIPGRHTAAQLAQFCLRHRSGTPRKAGQTSDALRPSRRVENRQQRVGRGTTRTGQGEGGLEFISRTSGLAAIQQGATRRF